MSNNYSLFEQTLQQYFTNIEVSGRRLKNPEVSLLRIEQGTWKNFWTQKAIYELTTTEKTDQFSTFSLYSGVKHGELIVTKKRNKLLVDLMTRYKTSNWRGEKGLTLENSFQITY